jgi:hypothetical protein
MSTAQVSRLFSSENNPKADKAQAYGYLNAIMYLAPAGFAGVGNLCPKASPGCKALCLGLHSGQAGMVAKGQRLNSVRASRVRKARAFMADRSGFLADVALAIAGIVGKAHKFGLIPAIRLNGSTDLAYERFPVSLTEHDAARIAKLSRGICTPSAGVYPHMFAAFPGVQFLDYTKLENRTRKALPANYHLTFSRAENNAADVARVLQTEINIAAVFANGLPDTWEGRKVISGDSHDLRFLDPKGVVVGLTPKGSRAKRDRSGFVIRQQVGV